MKRTSRDVERREQERAAGLLGERWMREPSNGPSVARRALARALKRGAREFEAREQLEPGAACEW